jgi:hypothetical protein
MSPDSEPSPRVPWLPVNEGATPVAPALPEHLTPTKPTVPAWIQRDPAPQPVEAEDAQIVAPVAPPLANEVLPPLGVETTVDAPDEPPAGLWDSDPVHMLGESAVASAALSAAGAPTPLGGVPVVAPAEHVTPPAFGDTVPRFTPRFEQPPPDAVPASPAATDFVAAEQARLAAQATLLDGGAAYTPKAFVAPPPEDDGELDERPASEAGPSPEPSTLPGSNPAPEPSTASDTVVLPVTPEPEFLPPVMPPAVDEDAPEPPRKKRKWWLWVLLGLLGAAVSATAVALLNKPEPTVIPGVTVTLAPAEPTIEPIPAPTDTEFQASMPTEVGTYALVEATPLEPADIALTAGRVADGIDLTYRSGADTMTVRALQYYNEDDATAMFTEFAGEGAQTAPVEADGAVVGESAIVTSPEPGIVWRNGTSVFILTGPPTQLTAFYEQFGL